MLPHGRLGDEDVPDLLNLFLCQLRFGPGKDELDPIQSASDILFVWEWMIATEIVRLLILDRQLAILEALVRELDVPIKIFDDKANEVAFLHQLLRVLLPCLFAIRRVRALSPPLDHFGA